MKINKKLCVSVSLCSINKTMSDLSLRDIKYLQGVNFQRAAVFGEGTEHPFLQGLVVLFSL